MQWALDWLDWVAVGGIGVRLGPQIQVQVSVQVQTEPIDHRVSTERERGLNPPAVIGDDE